MLPRNWPPIARFCFGPPNYSAARLELLFFYFFLSTFSFSLSFQQRHLHWQNLSNLKSLILSLQSFLPLIFVLKQIISFTFLVQKSNKKTSAVEKQLKTSSIFRKHITTPFKPSFVGLTFVEQDMFLS